jgi:hypothetical protein
VRLYRRLAHEDTISLDPIDVPLDAVEVPREGFVNVGHAARLVERPNSEDEGDPSAVRQIPIAPLKLAEECAAYPDWKRVVALRHDVLIAWIGHAGRRGSGGRSSRNAAGRRRPLDRVKPEFSAKDSLAANPRRQSVRTTFPRL